MDRSRLNEGMVLAARTILVVDPDKEVGALVDVILGEEGYRVTDVDSLDEARRLLSESHFDLIITEAFGQKDVIDFDPSFLSELRLSAGYTPIVLFSSYVCDSSVGSHDFGLAEAVPKPFDVDTLITKVNNVLRESESTSGCVDVSSDRAQQKRE